MEKEAGGCINQQLGRATSRGSQLGAGLPPRGPLAMSEGIFGRHTGEGWRPVGGGQSSTTKSYLAQMSAVLRLRHPALERLRGTYSTLTVT